MEASEVHRHSQHLKMAGPSELRAHAVEGLERDYGQMRSATCVGLQESLYCSVLLPVQKASKQVFAQV